LQGITYASKYKLPVECNIDIINSEKLLYNTTSDKQGVFNLQLQAKYQNTEMQALITPIKDHPTLDTNIGIIQK
jgi:hypothetical protein